AVSLRKPGGILRKRQVRDNEISRTHPDEQRRLQSLRSSGLLNSGKARFLCGNPAEFCARDK
ncbi:hypothetical protein C0U44_31300, partial [Klebsiella pneumoniae]